MLLIVHGLCLRFGEECYPFGAPQRSHEHVLGPAHSGVPRKCPGQRSRVQRECANEKTGGVLPDVLCDRGRFARLPPAHTISRSNSHCLLPRASLVLAGTSQVPEYRIGVDANVIVDAYQKLCGSHLRTEVACSHRGPSGVPMIANEFELLAHLSHRLAHGGRHRSNRTRVLRRRFVPARPPARLDTASASRDGFWSELAHANAVHGGRGARVRGSR
jgi:hypothetical protein